MKRKENRKKERQWKIQRDYKDYHEKEINEGNKNLVSSQKAK